MKFITLGQLNYKDDNGNPISSREIDYIAPYRHIVDGFYEWECGNCKARQSSRSCGWPIAGQVLKCTESSNMGGSPNGCGKMNLLVKTNTEELDECFSNKLKLERREQEIKLKEEKLNEYIHKSQWEKLVKLFKEFQEFEEKQRLEIHNLTQHLI